MKVHKAITAVCATALISTGAFLLPAVASSQSAAHTLTFTSVTKKAVNFSKTTFGQEDVDVNAAGKTIGFDTIYGQFNVKSKTAKGRVALDTSGGFIYGTLKFSNSPVTHGKVTGGTGQYKGIKGTILGKDLNKKGSRTAVTITYHH
jgi:hypothetical protein